MLSYTMRIVVMMSATLALHTAQAMQRKALAVVPPQAQDTRYTDLQQQAKNLNEAIVQKEGCFGHVICSVTNNELLSCDPCYEGGIPREPEFLNRIACESTCGDVVDGISIGGVAATIGYIIPSTTSPCLVALAFGSYVAAYFLSTQSLRAPKERNKLGKVREEIERIEYARWAEEHPDLVYRGRCE